MSVHRDGEASVAEGSRCVGDPGEGGGLSKGGSRVEGGPLLEDPGKGGDRDNGREQRWERVCVALRILVHQREKERETEMERERKRKREGD